MNAQKPDRHELQANGKHPAPCAKFCEATAFTIELRRAQAEIKVQTRAADHWMAEANKSHNLTVTQQAENARLNADRRVLQADGNHPAPCAKFCEATAFTIELRRAQAEIERLKEEITRLHEDAAGASL